MKDPPSTPLMSEAVSSWQGSCEAARPLDELLELGSVLVVLLLRLLEVDGGLDDCAGADEVELGISGVLEPQPTRARAAAAREAARAAASGDRITGGLRSGLQGPAKPSKACCGRIRRAAPCSVESGGQEGAVLG